MKNIKSIIVTTIVLTVICAVSAAGLAGTNALTSKRIADAEIKAEQKAMTRIIKAEKYEPKTVTVNGAEIKYYKAVGGETNGYIFTTSANGYGGMVKVMTGMDNNGKIVALEVLSASDETPGLGQNVTKDTFWEQFKDKSDSVALGAGIDSVTGATISSKAVVAAVNDAFDIYKAVKEGGKNG